MLRRWRAREVPGAPGSQGPSREQAGSDRSVPKPPPRFPGQQPGSTGELQALHSQGRPPPKSARVPAQERGNQPLGSRFCSAPGGTTPGAGRGALPIPKPLEQDSSPARGEHPRPGAGGSHTGTPIPPAGAVIAVRWCHLLGSRRWQRLPGPARAPSRCGAGQPLREWGRTHTVLDVLPSLAGMPQPSSRTSTFLTSHSALELSLLPAPTSPN